MGAIAVLDRAGERIVVRLMAGPLAPRWRVHRLRKRQHEAIGFVG